MICAFCGQQISDTAKFCNKCGKLVTPNATSPGNSSNQPFRNYNTNNNTTNNNSYNPFDNGSSNTGNVYGNGYGTTNGYNGNAPYPDSMNNGLALGMAPKAYRPDKEKFEWKDKYTYMVLAGALVLAIVGGVIFKLANSNKNNENQYANEDNYSDTYDDSYDSDDAPMDTEYIPEDTYVGDNNDTNDELEWVDLSENSELYLYGYIKGNGTDSYCLYLEDPLNFSGYDDNGSFNQIEGVTQIDIVEYDALSPHMKAYSTAAGNDDYVKIGGYCYISGNNVYVYPDALYNSSNEDMFAIVDSSDYIIPNSDTRKLTESDVEYLSLQEINYAKNEIYARHGRKFKSKELRDYFNSKDWYNGTIDSEDFSDNMLSSVEAKNAKFLSEVEYSIDPKGYQLDQ